MIARKWHGRTSLEKADAGLEFRKQRAVPDYAGIPGEDVLKAKYYPEDADFLLEFEPEVSHYDVTVGIELDTHRAIAQAQKNSG